MNLIDTLLAQQLLSDEAPPVSSVIQTETMLIFKWRHINGDSLVIEINLERRAFFQFDNWSTGEHHTSHCDADAGWPAEGKRYLMRFNRRAA